MYRIIVRGLPSGVHARVLFCLLFVIVFTVITICPSFAQTIGSSSTRSRNPSVFELSTSIPGTVEYQTQQQAHIIEACLTEIDAISACSVTLRVDEKLAAVTSTIALEDGVEWSSELEQTVIAILSEFVPNLSDQQILIADRRGRVLYNHGISYVPPDVPPPGVPSMEAETPRRNSSVAFLVIVVGALFGMLVIFFVGRAYRRRSVSRIHQKTQVVRQWAFLREYDKQIVRAVMAEQRPEVIGAIEVLLDAPTRQWMHPILKRLKQELRKPVRGIGAVAENALRNEIRDACIVKSSSTHCRRK